MFDYIAGAFRCETLDAYQR